MAPATARSASTSDASEGANSRNSATATCRQQEFKTMLQVLKSHDRLALTAPHGKLHVPPGFALHRNRDGRDYLLPARFVGRRKTNDMMTFDSQQFTVDTRGNMRGKTFDQRYTTHDGKTVDSSGIFLVGELERMDMTMHAPLVAISFPRDIKLREDVSVADEVSSFTVSTFGAPGGLGTGQTTVGGISWIGKTSTAVTRTSVDIAKITQPLSPWGEELAYDIFELESAAKVGRPVDQQKYDAIKLKHQMDIDQMVYYGDTARGFYGIVNSNNRAGSDAVTAVSNVPNGAQGTTQWSTKTPAEILADFNLGLVTAWANSGFAVIPDKVLLPTSQFGFISTELISTAGTVSILKYIRENNLLETAGVGTLDIDPVKWCNGAGQGGTIGQLGTVDRMITYTNDKDRLRYPMTMLQQTPVQYDGLWHKRTSYCKLGVLEIVYPETIDYLDGI
jgi:hypothetical protein